MNTPMCLFVYGTLLTSADHPMGLLLRANSTLIGTGHIQARLYMIDDPDLPGNRYPGALPSPDPTQRVYGELYALTAPEIVLPEFDEYEACSPNWAEPYEFLRRTVPVTMHDGEVLEAVTYLYTWDVSKAEHLPSGRFQDRSPDTK